MRPSRSLTLIAMCLLSACASKPDTLGTPDNEPTLKTLAGRTAQIENDQGLTTNKAQAIEGYRKFLEMTPNAPQRAAALHRIGDLEMNGADSRSENSKPALDPDYSAAVGAYKEFLNAYPTDPAADLVLYQLARAQEQGGELESALQTLTLLIKNYPATTYRDEVQFRRGELLFTARDYLAAEQAYATVLRAGPAGRYHDRALYMQGWSQFKEGKYGEAVQSFLGVLDRKVVSYEGDSSLYMLKVLTRADRELVEDTFRATSLSLTNLQGIESIPAYINSPKRLTYEFRLYEQLGELYLKQERVKDAADTFALFARGKPLDAQAPLLLARVIDIYQHHGFATLALETRKEYVGRYGSKSAFRRADPQGWKKAQLNVKTNLAELARHYHASAQKSKRTEDYQEAMRWYREYLDSFPSDPQSAQINFLLAELLFEDGRFAQASVEYEKTAYSYPTHAKSADAGYSALLSYAQQKEKVAAAELPALQQVDIESALNFALTFVKDPRTALVLAHTAEKLYVLKNSGRAAVVAQKVLDLQPAAANEQRRIAWTVLAYTTFERAAFDRSEQAFAEVLKLTPSNAANRNELVERQAAAIYKQGEQARSAGQMRDAVRHFERVSMVAPQSTVRATAQYDAAATLIALKDWGAAARTLEDFRQRFPNHPLQAEVPGKLAVVYLGKSQWASAAAEFERLAINKDPKVARDALWQAAELYEKAGSRATAAKTYERYIALHPQPLEPAIEARFRLAGIANKSGNAARELSLMNDIFQADQSGGGARTDRTRHLGASAALALAEPVAQSYRKIALTEPLKKQLKLKKAKMEEALKAYAVAAGYGVADVTTAATYHIATVYRDFGTALMTSERPKKLNKMEREQYDVLLEEQAFPFEEKATEVHAVNVQRAASGIYDQWVKKSFGALRELQPIRYGKTEHTEGAVDAIR